MDLKIDNLRALTKGINLNKYQRALAIQELKKLEDLVWVLTEELKKSKSN